MKWALKKELLSFFEKYDTLQVKETVSHSDYHSLKDKITAVYSEAFKASLALVAIETKIEESEKKEKELKEEKAKIEKGANKKISPAAGKSFCTYSFQ